MSAILKIRLSFPHKASPSSSRAVGRSKNILESYLHVFNIFLTYKMKFNATIFYGFSLKIG